MKSVLLILLLTLSACAQPNDDEFWAQRILSAAQVVSARLDHAGRHTALCIRKARPSMPPLYTSYPYDLKFIVPDGAPQTSRVRAARAQAAGTITSAWLRYTGKAPWPVPSGAKAVPPHERPDNGAVTVAAVPPLSLKYTTIVLS